MLVVSVELLSGLSEFVDEGRALESGAFTLSPLVPLERGLSLWMAISKSGVMWVSPPLGPSIILDSIELR
jgi:hypothetical protein